MSKAKGKRKTGRPLKTPFSKTGKASQIQKSERSAPIGVFDEHQQKIFSVFLERVISEGEKLKAQGEAPRDSNKSDANQQQRLLASVLVEGTGSIPIIEAIDRATYGKKTIFHDKTEPEDDGWTLINDWPELFRLYQRADEFQALSYPHISAVRDALMRGHSVGEIEAAKVEEALLLVAAGRTISKDFFKENELGIERYAFINLIESIGQYVFAAYTEESKDKAEIASESAVAVFKKAMRGIVRMHHHSPAPHTGEQFPRAVLAISFSEMLCSFLKRLPTKSELRTVMESNGFGYAATSKGNDGKWNGLFNTAGLGELPD